MEESRWRSSQDTPRVDRVVVPPPTDSAEPTLAGAWLLLVDDSEANRKIVVALLERAGACVELATSGEEGVDVVGVRARQGAPHDLILMDLSMPGIDGFEATRRVRDSGYTGPIVATTAYADPEQHERAVSAGCDAVVVKPFQPREFLCMLERLVQGETAGEQAGAVAREELVALEELPAVVVSECSGDEGLEALVEWFVDEARDDAQALEEALAGGDLERVRLLSHRLKGAAGNYGFPEVSRIAGVVERRVESEADDVEQGVLVLATTLRRLQAG